MIKRIGDRIGCLRAVIGCALLLALTPAGALGAAPAPPRGGFLAAPHGPTFYRPPARLLNGKPGSVIWARSTPTPAAVRAAAHTTLVLYRSVLPNGKPTAVSGLIFTPRGKAPKNGWRLISWAHGTTGIADQCAPSRDPASNYMYPEFNGWLKRGYAIAQTDYQGLGTPGLHLYLIGRAEGASVVDIALAARTLDPSIGRKFAIAGHSQGGQAALFAAAEAPADAPGLKFVGVAAFAPASHFTTQFQAAGSLTTPGGGLSALGGLILTSAAAASPGAQRAADAGRAGARTGGSARVPLAACPTELLGRPAALQDRATWRRSDRAVQGA